MPSPTSSKIAVVFFDGLLTAAALFAFAMALDTMLLIVEYKAPDLELRPFIMPLMDSTPMLRIAPGSPDAALEAAETIDAHVADSVSMRYLQYLWHFRGFHEIWPWTEQLSKDFLLLFRVQSVQPQSFLLRYQFYQGHQ